MKKEKTRKTNEKKKDAKKRSAPAVLVIESEPAARSTTEVVLKENGSFGEQFFGSSLEEAHQLVKAHSPDLLILGDDDSPEKALSFIERVANSYPNITTFFSSFGEDSNLLIRAMRAGVREFLRCPIEKEDFTAACSRYLNNRVLHGLSPRKSGKIICL